MWPRPGCAVPNPICRRQAPVRLGPIDSPTPAPPPIIAASPAFHECESTERRWARRSRAGLARRETRIAAVRVSEPTRCHSVRIALFRYGSRPWPSDRRDARSASTAPPKPSTSSSFRKRAYITGASSKASNVSSWPLFFGTQGTKTPSQVFDWGRFHFFDRAELWFNHAPVDTCSPARGERNAVTLSEAFFEEVDHHRIPAERQAVASLANAPGLLDFYIWIVWKSSTVKGGTTRIPLFGHW